MILMGAMNGDALPALAVPAAWLLTGTVASLFKGFPKLADKFSLQSAGLISVASLKGF